jgi:hypothetical protein
MLFSIMDETTLCLPVEPEALQETGSFKYPESGGATSPRMLTSYRYLLTLTFLGSLFLPPLAYLSSPRPGAEISSSSDSAVWIIGYGIVAGLALLGFYRLLVKLEPRVDRLAQEQVEFLESISGRSLSIAIAASAALGLFLELAVIRWQGTIFEFVLSIKTTGCWPVSPAWG